MKLRWSILGVILLTFIGLVSILTVSLQGILVPHFREEEDRAARLNVQRMLGVLENEQVSLTRAVRTWTNSNETYAYMQNASPEYLQRNLSESVLTGPTVLLSISRKNVNTARQGATVNTRIVDVTVFPDNIRARSNPVVRPAFPVNCKNATCFSRFAARSACCACWLRAVMVAQLKMSQMPHFWILMYLFI